MYRYHYRYLGSGEVTAMDRNKGKKVLAVEIILVLLLVVFIGPVAAVVLPADGGNMLTVSGVILPGGAPVAAFSATPLTGAVPLTVRFTDQSTNLPASWEWEYKPGSGSWTRFSTAQNPSFTFTAPGTCSIRLTATNTGGSDTSTKTDYITVASAIIPPVARFTQDNFIGRSPLTVHFTDHSRNNPTSYFWQFGDGSTSRDRDPVHTYSRTGFYVIREQVSNAAGSDTAFSAVVVLITGGRFW
jgi:PKD repeat protein